MARARDRQEGPRHGPHRSQAQAADHDTPARAPARGPDDRLRHGHDVQRGDRRALPRSEDQGREPLHRVHAREGHHDARRRGADRGLQEAAPRRAADARQRARTPALALLRSQALRPHEGRPLQAQPAPARVGRHAGRRPADPDGRARAHDARHPDARAQARLAARHARRPARLEGLRRRLPQPPARSDRARARRVRALRQPPAARRRRAHPGGLPHRPLPHGARRARAHDDRGRGHDHASDDHQHPPGRRGAEGVLRLVAALAVHGPDELARRAHPPPPPLGARRGRPHARARAHRGARRPLDPLRAHVPDRDPGGPEHRPHRLALELRHGVRVRLHPGAVPQGGQGQAERRDHLPRRLQGRAPRDRAVQRGDRQDRQARLAGARAPARRRARPGRRRGRRLHGRRARADRLGRHGADPVPRAQRREPRADGLEHAAAGRAADDHAGAVRRHRPGVPGRGRHRRRRARDSAPARSRWSTPSGS